MTCTQLPLQTAMPIQVKETPPTPDTEPQTYIEDAYRIAYKPAELPKGQQRIDRMVDRITTVPESPTLKFVNEFYQANQAAIEAAALGITSSIDSKSVETAINGFAETTKVVMEGLNALGQAHPFIAVAVLAFKLVVTLDLTRRENNRKVLAVKIQMQDMMTVLFQLRHVKDPEEVGPDGTTLKDRMQGLMETIAKDVTECGSACDHYMKKGFLAKTIKSKIYESRLAGYASLFSDHRTEIERALTIHTALGVDTANLKLDNQDKKLRSIEDKLDMMLLFRKLDSPREKDVQKFMDENGGAKACIEKDELLNKLIAKSGESIATYSEHAPGKRSDDLTAARKKLNKELLEDLDEALKKNLVLFERKLDVLTDSIKREAEHIITAIFSGAHDKISDTDLQNIWKEMGWKGSVKARHFVLALHDYFTDQFSTTRPNTLQITQESPLLSPSSPLPGTPSGADKTAKDERWTLQYINIAHVQSILEAVDDDGTGFVSIKEVNTFVKSRPQGWTLLHWIAYWAAGWETSVSTYKNKIYLLVQKMFGLVDKVLPSNRRIVDDYLSHFSFWRIDLLLRSTHSTSHSGQTDHELVRVTEAYTAAEEERLSRNLESVAFEIDTSATVALITGPGRIERYIYPLLYLLLKQQLKVLMLSCKHVLDTEEFISLSESLTSVLWAMDYRIQSLEAIFKQTHLDVGTRLGNFAFGMFQLSHGDIERNPGENSFAGWSDESAEKDEDEDIDTVIAQVPVNVLKYGTKDTFETEAYTFSTQKLLDTDREHPVQGTWAGHCYTVEKGKLVSHQGLVQMSLGPVIDDAHIEGKGESFSGLLDIVGAINVSEASGYEVILTMSYRDGYTFRCSGKLDLDAEVITGEWTLEGQDDQDEEGGSSDSGSESESQEDAGDIAEEVDEGEDGQDEEGGSTDLRSEHGSQQGAGDIVEEVDGENGEWTDEVDEAVEEDAELEEGDGEAAEGKAETAGDESSEAEEGSDNADSAGPTLLPHTFRFTRTPPFLWRFRYTPEEFEASPARARWSFACAAVLHNVQRRLWSWRFFKARFTERRRFLELSTRLEVDLCNYTPREKLTQDEYSELGKLKREVYPTDSRFYYSLVLFHVRSMPWHCGYTCDSCNRELIQSRLLCTQCVNDEFSDCIDLCTPCMDETVSRDDFTHDPSHDLVKVGYVLHDYQLAWAIREAKIVAERVKAAFRDLEEPTELGHIGGGIGTHASSTFQAARANTEMLCACCGKAVSTPCWVCVICTPDTFICQDCDLNRLPALPNGPAPNHSLSHALVRVRDSEEHSEEDDDERMLNIENKLSALDTKVETRLAALESNIEARFAAFESMLRRIIGHFEAAPVPNLEIGDVSQA